MNILLLFKFHIWILNLMNISLVLRKMFRSDPKLPVMLTSNVLVIRINRIIMN
jgi:hypothetical protein